MSQTIERSNNEEMKGTQEYIEKYFPIVKASTLSLEDDFIKHKPETNNQKKFKEKLIVTIKSGLSDFRAQRMDACFDEEGNICFKVGMKPAVGKSANWWKKNAKEFLPEKGSRLGTTKERIAFLGLLIKYLIEEKGYTISDAWKAVCDQSRNLGHYWDSDDAKHDFEDTGSRQVGEWYDLGNTRKITVDDNASGFSVGGSYIDASYYCPLASMGIIFNSPGEYYGDSVGWLVLSNCTNYQEETNKEEIKKGTQEYIEKYFPIVKASTLSLEDNFIKHKPETNNQKEFKEKLIATIKSGLSDFRAQRMDACFNKKGNICFKAGMKPAIEKPPIWWDKNAKEFLPEKGSRLGTTKERIAFLGLLIKYLIEEKGYTISDAWKAVCDQSKDLGHYKDSDDTKHVIEDTGSRQVGEWYDLANTKKITVGGEASGFSIVGGNYVARGKGYPLAFVYIFTNPNYAYYFSVGWVVMNV